MRLLLCLLLFATPALAQDVSISVPAEPDPSEATTINVPSVDAPPPSPAGLAAPLLSTPDLPQMHRPAPMPEVSAPTEPAATPAPSEHYQIAAVVNDAVITRLELEERMRLAIATTGLPNTIEVRRQLLGRILQTLVNEALQSQEAKKNSITVDPGEVDQAIASLEQERGKQPGSLAAFLSSRGVPERTMRGQLQTQIAWNKLVGKKIRRNVRVSGEEIDAEIERRTSPAAKKQEVLLASLVLPVESPEAEPQTRELASKLIDEIHHGASFEALSSQLSATQAANIGATWVDLGQLPPEVSTKIDEISPPGIVGPVRTPSGYQILQVQQKREASLAASDDELNFRRILFSLKEDAQTKEVDLLMKIAKDVRKAPGPCTQKSVAGIQSFEGLNIDVDYQRARMSQLSSSLRPLVENLGVGEVSEPFATPKGIELMMLCEKISEPTSPNRDKVEKQLQHEKLELEVQKYMRNLRRTAFIDARVRPSRGKAAPSPDAPGDASAPPS